MPPARTRVAPSPTGDPHVGTAYQSLFDYALAHHSMGVIVLRGGRIAVETYAPSWGRDKPHSLASATKSMTSVLVGMALEEGKLKSLDQPGLKVEDVFKAVRINVMKATGEQQIPWESSSLTGDFYFRAGERRVAEKDKPQQAQLMKALDDVGYQGWGISEQPGDQSKDADALKDLSERMDKAFAS